MTFNDQNSTQRNGELARSPLESERDPLVELRPLKVVGIGASAGGLEALEQFFKAMPAQTGLAFVVVQHLSPDFRSLMDELLAHRTSIPIFRVEDGMRVEPDAIYLIPPKKEMIISGGRLLLTDKDPAQGLTLPIDHFFRSLAQDVGRDAIAIILSGTGSDGSRGIRDINEAGGLVMAQCLESSKFDGMPKSAIDTGIVDLILPPHEMPAALLRHVSHPLAETLVDRSDSSTVVESTMGRLFHLLRDECGIDFSYYKPTTVRRRIERRLQMNRIDDFDEYVELLGRDPAELNSLYKDLLIGVTNFFRDREAFERLRSDVLPGLLAKYSPGDEFRVWVAGCATGEEAYSLTILLNEQMEEMHRRINVKVFATDVHRASIELASTGIYPEEALSGVGPALLERYFVRKGNNYQVTQDLRQMIVFAHHNILKDAPFTKLDLIACRNLLIYLLPPAQKKVLSLFHFGLKTGGALFLGPSETPSELGDEFDTIDAHWKIYRKRRDVRLPHDLRLPMATNPSTQIRPGVVVGSPYPPRALDGELNGVFEAMLGEFMPPSLLLNEQRELIHSFGGAERYLRVKGGKTSTNILDLVDADLRITLSGALNRAAKEQSQVQYKGILVGGPGGEVRLKIDVRPIINRRSNSTLTLVVLQEEQVHASAADLAEPRQFDIEEATRERVETLEGELRYTKESLQATVEELETSNEELQATNEELVASNEELQSTNEELHSVNEELYTVNAEYQRKIHELQQLNNDMDNLLRSTDIGTIFLDGDLCIRKFTPQIARSFRLLPQDVGRPIDTFTHSIRDPKLQSEIVTVLQTGHPIEREVQDRDGTWYFLRILPYRSAGPQIEGVVLTLIDISVLKQIQEALKERTRQLQAILDNSPTFLYVKDLDGRYQLCSRISKQVLGAAPEEVLGKTDYDFLPREVAEEVQAHDRQAAAQDKPLQFEETILQADGERTYLSVKFPLRDESGKTYAIGAVCADVTQLKRSEEQQRLAVIRRDQFLAMLSHELRNPLSAIVTASHVLEMEPLSDSLQEVREIITRQANHMSRLLDDLLDVSRVTQDKIEMRKEVLDLRETTKDAVQAVQSRLQSRGQQLELALSGEPVFVEGDPARLQQVQVNLLSNASKYNLDHGRIWLTLERQGEEAIIRVKDDGIGIPLDMRDSIFDLFVQCSDSKDRSDGGLGLGLTLARSIIEKHNGSISVFSDGPGKGSEFVIHLPVTSKRLAQDAEMGVAAGAFAAASATRSNGALNAPHHHWNGQPKKLAIEKLLIIEDNHDARETLKTLLERHGVRGVLTAANGELGLRLVEQHSPDVALVDIGLPELDGYEVARRIRGELANEKTFLVALTGYGQAADREAALAAGFDAHIVKPVNLDRLMATLARRCSRIKTRGT